MSDYKFEPTKTRRAFRFRATRGAVYTPILGKKWVRGGVAKALYDIRDRWQKRLSTLQNAGWLKVANDGDYQYYRNCPPIEVITRDMSRHCGMSSICPFCHARRFVLSPFKKMEMALSKSFATKPGEFEFTIRGRPFVLVEFINSVELRPSVKSDWNRESKMKSLETAKVLIRQERLTEARRLSSVGGVVLHRIRMRHDAWTLIRSGVLICDGSIDHDLTPLPGANEILEQFIVHDEPTKAGMADAFGRVFQYLPEMLTVEPEDIDLFWTMMQKMHMISTHGIVRKQRPPEHA